MAPPPDSATQPYIDAALASGTRQGYTYMVEVIPGDAFTNPAFAARAIPIVHGRSGRRNFYVDEEGVLRFTVGLEGVDPLGPDSPEVE